MSEIKTENPSSNNKPVLYKLKKIKPISRSSAEASSSDQTDSLHCVLCRKRYPNHEALKEHFRIHGHKKEIPILIPSGSLTGPISCDFCPMVLPNLSKAIQHKYRKHRYIGQNHFCESCGSLFPLRLALEQHKQNKQCTVTKMKNSTLSDTKVKNDKKVLPNSNESESISNRETSAKFECSFCCVTFLTKEALLFHEHSVHKIQQYMLSPMFVPPPSTKIKVNDNNEIFSVYYCHLCGSEYVSKFNLKRHLIEYHKVEEKPALPANEDVIRCITCEAIFFTKKAYEAHTIHHRPNDRYVLSEEHRKKVVNKVDQDFDFRRIPIVDGGQTYYVTKRRQTRKSSDEPKVKIEKESDDESLSPPSTPSNSSDEEETITVIEIKNEK